MTYRIEKSKIPAGFETEVASYAFELRTWREHMNRVAVDKENDAHPDVCHVAYPQPRAKSVVEASVNEDGIPDYEIVNDDPTPEQILAEKKKRLLQLVSDKEVQETDAVLPPHGKRRIYSMREADIRKNDAAIVDGLKKKGVLAKLAAAVGFGLSVDIGAEVRKNRDPKDTEFLDSQETGRARVEVIRKFAAQLHSDIEDLTLDNIDAWKMPDFPK